MAITVLQICSFLGRIACVWGLLRLMSHVAWSMCLSVLVTLTHGAKKVEPIEMSFGGLTHMGPRSHVLDGVQMLQEKRQFWRLSGPLKNIGSHCCGVRSKKSITASARLAPDWLVSQ